MKANQQNCKDVRPLVRFTLQKSFYLITGWIALTYQVDSLAQSCSGGTQNITTNVLNQVTINANSSCVSVNVNGAIVSSTNGVGVTGGVLDAGIVNRGTITTNGNNFAGVLNQGNLTSLTNYSLVQSTATFFNGAGYGVTNTGAVGSIINSGTIEYSPVNAAAKGYGILNTGTISTIDNSGILRSLGANPSSAVYNSGGTITNFINRATGTVTAITGVRNTGVITTLTNAGTFANTLLGIVNNGTIGTLNNGQGFGNNSGALTYFNVLPTRYNVLINSTTDYGRLAVDTAGGSTTFGVYGGGVTGVAASTLSVGTYTSVLTGVSAANLTGGTTGAYGSYTWSLNNVNGTTWDLVVAASSGGAAASSDTTVRSALISNILFGMRVYLTDLGPSPIFNGGTLVLLPRDYSSLSFVINPGGGIIESPAMGVATLSGTFSGDGRLTFTGTGTTIMSGANTYSGGTTVSGGTLSVAGASPTGTGDVFVASAGTLMGTGTIAGNGLVSGVLKPGNSPGYLSFTQNLTLNAGSTYQQDIAGATQASSATPMGASGYYSFVNVGNQLTITSGATLTPRLSNLFSASEAGYGSSIYVPVLGDKFRIITAGGITGRFTTLTQPAELSSGTQLVAFYNVNSSNSLDLVTVPTSYSTTLSSSTTNAKAVASVLDQLLGVNKAGTASSAQDSLLYSAAGQTAASLPTFAQALAGEIHAASVATLPQTTQRVQQSVLARLGDYPMAPSQINPALNNALLTGGISATNPSGLPTANMSTNPAVNPNAVNVVNAAVADGRAWGEIAYQRTERASNSGGNGFNSNLYQIVTGVDAYSDAELGLKLGGGIALSNTTVAANGGNSTIQQGSLFVYGKMSVLQDYILDGMASVGLSSTNLSRNDPTGYTGGFSSKAVMGNDALVSVGLSRGFEYDDVRITPYARLTYQYVGQNSYDEGSGVAALNIARFSGSAVRGVIGVAAGSLNKDPLKDEYTYRANIAVGADTSGLLNPTLNTTLGGFSSTVTTATAGSAFVQVGLYGTVKIADNAYAYAGVSGEARSGQTLYGGSVGLRMAF